MKKVVIALLAGAAVAAAATASSAATLIGSYWVGAGPNWTTNPPVYTPQEAAALIFGGVASDYSISISSTIVTHTGWEDGWGNTQHLKTDWFGQGSLGPVAENYSLTLGTGYNDPVGGPAFSAYVSDHDGAYTNALSADASINYVFAATGVPEPSVWAMLLVGMGGVGYAMRRTGKKGLATA